MYGRANGNSKVAARFSSESYRNRRYSDKYTFGTIRKGLFKYNTNARGVQQDIVNPELRKKVFNTIVENPTNSTRNFRKLRYPS